MYPDLSSSPKLAVDIETHDPNLKEMGNGVYRKDGKILGVSISDGTFSEYYNIGHYDCGTEERKKNLAYLRQVMKWKMPKIGANWKYDLDWLENGEHNIKVMGKLYDIEVDEALIDENQVSYSLDALAYKYLHVHKVKEKPQAFCEEHGLVGDFRKWLFKMPYALVRDYAIGDVTEPLAIHEKQQAQLAEWGMSELSEMENALTRCIILFRKTGARVDTERRDRNALLLKNKVDEMELQLFKEYGEFNYNSSQQIAKIFDKMGLAYPETENGNPNIDKYVFKMYEEKVPFVKLLSEIKQTRRTLDTFLMKAFTNFVTPDGRIHCDFHNTRTDEFGTVTGRFSASHPNLEQVPSPDRNKFLGDKCREIFIPFDGYKWGKIDLSQIEYRIIAHFALGPGSEALRQSYINDPNTDYHAYIMALTGLTRSLSKNLNFGCGFGMGAKKMAKFFGWELEYCKTMSQLYHQKAPYIRYTMREVEKVAVRRGYVRTVLGRRSHLVNKDEAYAKFNHLIQGSAGDYFKMCMLKGFNDGIWSVLPPHNIVHDEFDFSVPETKEGTEAFAELHHIMQTAITLKVPVIAEASDGPNWAEQTKLKKVS